MSTAPSHKPPRGPSLITLGVATAVALATLVVGILLGPTVMSWLERQEQAATDETAAGQWYISQMHPWIIQPEPGQCPICGMDLTPVDPDRFAGEIAIDPVVVQNMGVRLAPAISGSLQRELRTVGTVAAAEERLHDVVLRYGGWVDEVLVGNTWASVQAGDPLFRIYAPKVFVAEQEYLLARRNSGPQADRLLQAAKRKLELLDLPAAEWERLEAEGTAAEIITIPAPASGVVWEQNINPGSEVMAQSVTYRIADLSQVWVEAAIYEHQLPFIEEGQRARVQLAYGDRQEVAGTVDHIYPMVDSRTRAVMARLVFPNRAGAAGPMLKPGMFSTVFIEAGLPGERVLVPREAVIGTGERHVVFVSLGRGRFEPREVELGPAGDDGMVAIATGIAAGEQVVVSGQFLLDSESQMREALAKVMRGDLASDQAPAAEATTSASLPLTALDEWRRLVEAYLMVQGQLYDGTVQPAAIGDLSAATEAFRSAIADAQAPLLQNHPTIVELRDQATALQPGDTLPAAFGALSITLDDLVQTFGQPGGLDAPLVGMRCGMADGIPKKGVWLQLGSDTRNPYFGAESGMRGCAAETWGLPGGDASAAAQPEPEPQPQPQPQPQPTTINQLDAATTDSVLAMHQALYDGDLAAASAAAQGLPRWLQGPVIAEAADLDAARAAYGAAMVTLRDHLQKAGTASELVVYRCGMARGVPEKGIWVQRADADQANPYYGADSGMRACAMDRWLVTDSGLVAAE